MMEEEKLRMKEEQGSDFEEEEEDDDDDEEDEPLEDVQLKKDSLSSLKKSPSGGSCDSCEMAESQSQSDNNNKCQLESSPDNQVGGLAGGSRLSSPLEATPARKVSPA